MSTIAPSAHISNRATDAKPAETLLRTSIFSRMRHPCVLSLPEERESILANTQDPCWRIFLREVAEYFDSGEKVPTPKFPVFCHDGDLDAIMSTSVLAYVTKEDRYFNTMAAWLRVAIEYFVEKQPEWEKHLRMLTEGRATAEIDSRTQGNPRQFFEGFGLPGLYWVEGGLMTCILHLYDLLEAYAPDLLSESEKLTLENAMAHFALRFAFHEEALKYNNRAGWANVGMLIAALTTQKPETANFLLNRARERNHEMRATFSADGSFIEGSHAYHYLAADALALFALIHQHAFPDENLFDAFAGSNNRDPYPSIEKIMETHARVSVPGQPPREHPRGVGAHASHLPLLVRASMLLGYSQHNNPHIGWLINASRGVIKPASPSPMKLTNHTILSLGNYVPLETFWLERLPYHSAPPEPSLLILPDFGGLYSRSGGDDADNSFVWSHYGYHGTGKGERDCCHIGLSVGGHELLADPFPREGPAFRNSSFCHNTITAGRTESPITVGRLIRHESTPDADICQITNFGGNEPQRHFLCDPREESNYVFDIMPTDAPPFSLRRTIVHWHRLALIVVDDVNLRANSSLPLDWFFFTTGKPTGYNLDSDIHTEEYAYRRSTIHDSGLATTQLATHGATVRMISNIPATIRYEASPRQLRLLALPLTSEFTQDFGHIQHAGYRSADGRMINDRNAWFTRFRTQSANARIAWIWTWDEHKPVLQHKPGDPRMLLEIGRKSLKLDLDHFSS